MKAIEIKGLTKKYGDLVAVDNLVLEIESGEIFSLLGVNGAGKTTTIRLLSCLTRKTSGDAILLGSSSITDEPHIVKQKISVSPQENALAPGLTVRENLELITGISGLKKAKAKEKIDEISCMFDLSRVLNKKAGRLSGGWQRRVSIAMALISEPKILFLD